MMGKKKLSEIKAELIALLNQLPGPSAREWFDREIEAARGDPNRDVETLEMLCAVLEDKARKRRKPKNQKRSTRR